MSSARSRISNASAFVKRRRPTMDRRRPRPRLLGAPEAKAGSVREPALGTSAKPGHIHHMKLNSPESIKEAAKVFRSYGGSWTAARAAGQRNKDGVLVIPLNPVRSHTARGEIDARQHR
jgi:hypothetical protein